MSKIILDFGSGNTCKNNINYAKKMIDELKRVDSGKHEVIIKWQLFKQAGNNIPLVRNVFAKVYEYAKKQGYKTTASVFDKGSLEFLLQFDIPFVKISNNRKLDWLIGEVPRKIPVYVSYDNSDELTGIVIGYENVRCLLCVSKYPATSEDYEKRLQWIGLMYRGNAFSDHTINFKIWYKYQPAIIEWHYKLPDSTGLDAGPFARTPEQLSEVL